MASYNEIIIDMNTAGPGGGAGGSSPSQRFQRGGDFLILWGEDPADGTGFLDVRLDSPTAPIIRMRLGSSLGATKGTPFRELYIDWPAISGKRMGLLVGDGCSFASDSPIFAAFTPANPIVPGAFAGGASAFDRQWQSVADPAATTNFVFTATRRTFIWEVTMRLATVVTAGTRSMSVVSKNASGKRMQQAPNDTVTQSANLTGIFAWADNGRVTSSTNMKNSSNFPENNANLMGLQHSQSPIVLEEDWTLESEQNPAQPLVAGDQISEVFLLVSFP